MTLREKINQLANKEVFYSGCVYHAYRSENNAFYIGDVSISVENTETEFEVKVIYSKTLEPFLDEEVIDREFEFEEDIFLKAYNDEDIIQTTLYPKNL
jgi:hypothetical protein